MNKKTKILNCFRALFKSSIIEKWLRKQIKKNPKSFFAKLAPNNYQYKKNSFRKFKYNGVNLNADISELEKYRPKLFIELDDNNLKSVGDSALELINYLSELKFNITNAENGETVNSKTNFENCHFDIIIE